MFYNLNVPYAATDIQLPRTLAFLHELGYNVVALNHAISGKLPAVIACAIPKPLPNQAALPAKLEILRRVTLTLTEAYQNARLLELSRCYDVLALRPVDERTLQLACTSLECDIISLDLSVRLPYYFKHKMVQEALKLGKRFEICYAQGLMGGAGERRCLIGNAGQLIRATRGRGLIISSGGTGTAANGVGLRGPWDLVNLAAVWGLSEERGAEAVGKECRSVVVHAQLKRTGYRGVIDVVYGGEKPAVMEIVDVEAGAKGRGKQGAKQQAGKGEALKRKAEAMGDLEEVKKGEDKPLSNTQRKKRARLEKMEAERKAQESSAAASTGAATEQASGGAAPTGDGANQGSIGTGVRNGEPVATVETPEGVT